MGEEPGTGGSTVTAAQAPEQLRRAIDETREELGETVEALAAKTNFKARARRRLRDTRDSAAHKQGQLLGKAHNALPKGAADAGSQLRRQIRANPLPAMAIVAFLVGLLIGRTMKR